MIKIHINKQLIACFTVLFLISPVSAVGFYDVDTEFKVFPNKNYTGNVCIEAQPGSTVTLTNNSGIIKSFSVSELKPISFREFRCGTFTFSVSESKNTNKTIIGEQLMIVDQVSDNIFLGISKTINIDSSEVSYVNVLWKLSLKLVLTFISIFAILSLLLYMIRKIRKE